MTGLEVIEEIKRLPMRERFKVIEYARTANNGQMSPQEIGDLARRLAETTDPNEAERLKKELVRGFYGNEPHA